MSRQNRSTPKTSRFASVETTSPVSAECASTRRATRNSCATTNVGLERPLARSRRTIITRVNLKYEDDLSTPTALAETMRWLHDRYALDLNHEATKLLKLERVNAAVTAADIINVRALNAHAKYFLRTAVEPATDEIENAYDDEST